LDAEPDPGKQIAILRELASEGIDYVAVDPDKSVDRWVPAERDGKRILVGPLSAIKGIGPAKIREIMDCRKAGTQPRPALLKALQTAKTEIDSLFPIRDAVKRLHPDLTVINVFSEPTPVYQVLPGVRGDVMIFAVVRKISPRDENEDISIQKRNGKVLTGPTQSIHLFFADDTEEIFCRVDRFAYARLGPKLIEQAKAGKSLYAIKGSVPNNFRMINIKAIRYLGEIDK
jgi:hypothetical protein